MAREPATSTSVNTGYYRCEGDVALPEDGQTYTDKQIGSAVGDHEDTKGRTSR